MAWQSAWRCCFCWPGKTRNFIAMHKKWDFIKKHRFDILVALSVVAFFFDVYFSKHIISIVVVALYAFGYASDIERSRTNIAERKNLSRRGLTPEDIKNIAFT